MWYAAYKLGRTERIAAECSAPNANARILDGVNRIVAIVNNYASMRVQFGPSLLSGLEEKAARRKKG